MLVFPCRVDFGRLSMRKAHAPARHRLTQPTGLEKKLDVQFARRCGTAQHGLKRRGPAEKGFNIQHARGWSNTVMARERTGGCTQHLPFPLCVCPVCVKRGQIRMLFLSTQSLCCCCHGSDSKVTKLVIGCSFRKQDPSLCPQKRHPPYYFCNACALNMVCASARK